MDNLIDQAVSEMTAQEEREFKTKVQNSIQNIARLTKQKKQIETQLAQEKEEFRKLKLEATNFSELIS